MKSGGFWLTINRSKAGLDHQAWERCEFADCAGRNNGPGASSQLAIQPHCTRLVKGAVFSGLLFDIDTL